MMMIGKPPGQAGHINIDSVLGKPQNTNDKQQEQLANMFNKANFFQS